MERAKEQMQFYLLKEKSRLKLSKQEEEFLNKEDSDDEKRLFQNQTVVYELWEESKCEFLRPGFLNVIESKEKVEEFQLFQTTQSQKVKPAKAKTRDLSAKGKKKGKRKPKKAFYKARESTTDIENTSNLNFDF